MIASRVATRAIQRRPFSMLSSLRTAGRAMEAHPFERMPQTQKSAPADWGKQIRRVSSQAAFFFPGFALMLGWPLLAKAAVEQSGGYEMPPSMKQGLNW